MIEQEPEAYYRRLIAAEAASGEPELLLLPELVVGGTALDIGANAGIYAFALSEHAAEVHAFEPHPEYADFARRMLGKRATVHQLALSNLRGRAPLFVPIGEDGSELHLAGNLKNAHRQFARTRVVDARVETLDALALRDVRFIKIDVEGSELEVLDGGKALIARDRPTLLLELLSGTYPDPLAATLSVCTTYGYGAFVVHEGKRLDAAATIAGLNANTTWGSPIATRNVLFTPSSDSSQESADRKRG